MRDMGHKTSRYENKSLKHESARHSNMTNLRTNKDLRSKSDIKKDKIFDYTALRSTQLGTS